MAGKFRLNSIDMKVQIRVVVPNIGKMLKVIPSAITNDNLIGLNPCLNNLERERTIFVFTLISFSCFNSTHGYKTENQQDRSVFCSLSSLSHRVKHLL